MTKIDRDQTPAELAWVAERLEQDRPTASPLEFDRMKLQARTQAVRGARSQAKGSVLKSRVAIGAILMLGLFTGGTGTTLALQGNSGNAAQVQYPQQTPPPPNGTVLGQEQGPEQDGGVLGTEQGNGGGPGPGATQSSEGPVQSNRQVVATKGGSELPFTGLAAVPLIVLGLGLIATGTMLYRSARQEPSGT
ncbi:MAG: hypothetical protein M3375_00005 [Actinomycetota bacterium]|nr:hypothetical protein [Actinomycetota bacterium]